MTLSWVQHLESKLEPFCEIGSITDDELLQLLAKENDEVNSLHYWLFRLEQYGVSLVHTLQEEDCIVPQLVMDNPDINQALKSYLEQLSEFPVWSREEELEHTRRLDLANQRVWSKLLSMGPAQQKMEDLLSHYPNDLSPEERVFTFPNEENPDPEMQKARTDSLVAYKNELHRERQQQRSKLEICEWLEPGVQGQLDLYQSLRNDRKKLAVHLASQPIGLRVLESMQTFLGYQQRRIESARTKKQKRELQLLVEDSFASYQADMLELQELREIQEKYRKPIIRANLRLVVSIAKAYKGHGPFLELIHEGNKGLERATHFFQFRHGYRFSTYSTWWVRKHCVQVCRRS